MSWTIYYNGAEGRGGGTELRYTLACPLQPVAICHRCAENIKCSRYYICVLCFRTEVDANSYEISILLIILLEVLQELVFPAS